MDQAGINVIKMSGEELRKICDASGLSQNEFAEKKLKISRTQLNRLFVTSEIPDTVEVKIDTDRELVAIKNALFNKPVDQTVMVHDALKAYSEVAMSVKATLDIVTQLLLKQETKYDNLAVMADHVRKVSETHLSIIEEAQKAGSLRIR